MNEYDMLQKRWPLVVVLTLMAALVFAAPVLAAEIIEDEEAIIKADEVIEDDVVFGGESLTVDGVIEGDLVAAGSTVIVNGTVEGDLIAGAMSVTINGEVQDDVYTGAYALELGKDAVIGDELLVGAYSLEAGDGSSVGGDVLFGAFQALLGGDIAGDVKGGANGVQIDGSVGGDVGLGVGDPGGEVGFNFSQFIPDAPPVPVVPAGLTVSDGASIEGDLTYSSSGEGDIAGGAVQGRTQFERQVAEVDEEPEFEFSPTRPGAALGFVAGRFALQLVRRFVTLALIGLLIIWQVPKALTETVATFKARPWTSLGVGFLGYAAVIVALIVIPGLLILLGIVLGIVSLGGLTLGVIGFGSLGWGALLVAFVTAISWLAKIVMGFWLGDVIWKAIQPEATSLIPPLLVGAALAALLTAIPVLGGLLGFAVALFGLGALLLTLRERTRPAGEAAPAV